MTQQQVEQVFAELLTKGSTTTLDVKNKLREKYPLEDWNQQFVSTCCHEYYEELDNIDYHSNGTHRIYYLVSVPSASKSYQYTTSTGVKLETKTWIEMVDTASLLGENIHWSHSKQQFMGIWEMEDHHILNAIKLYLDENKLSPGEFAHWLQTSPYIKELVTRHPL